MTALDTNVLVRLLVQDDDEQTARAAALIERAADRDGRLFVSDVVVCELVWVLSGAYRFGRHTIAETLAELFRARQLSFTEPERLARSLRAYTAGRCDFADYLIREHGRAAGCEEVATFDKALLQEEGFVAA